MLRQYSALACIGLVEGPRLPENTYCVTTKAYLGFISLELRGSKRVVAAFIRAGIPSLTIDITLHWLTSADIIIRLNGR